MAQIGLKEAPADSVRGPDGTLCLSNAGLVAAGTPTATAVFKISNAINYAIKGIVYTKAVTDNIDPRGSVTSLFSGPLGKPLYAQPLGTTVYYSILIDAASNVSTMQGDVNGPISPYTMMTPSTGTISSISYVPQVVQTLQYQALPGQTPVLTAAGSYNVVTVTTSAAHNLQTGDIVQLNGILNSNVNGQAFQVTVTSSTTFTLDNCDPSMLGTAPGVNTGSTFVQMDAARCLIGALKLTLGSSGSTFTPGTTAIASLTSPTVTYLNFVSGPLNQRP